jgi:putative membrane protein
LESSKHDLGVLLGELPLTLNLSRRVVSSRVSADLCEKLSIIVVEPALGEIIAALEIGEGQVALSCFLDIVARRREVLFVIANDSDLGVNFGLHKDGSEPSRPLVVVGDAAAHDRLALFAKVGLAAAMTELLPPRGTWPWARLPLVLAIVLLVVFVPTLLMSPEGPLNWLLEVGPGLIGIIVLGITYRRFPMSRLVYVAVFLHILILVYGGYYTYAKAPLGELMREVFHWHRNNYDKVGHFAFGFFPVLILREVFLRATPLRRGGWLTFILVAVMFGLAAVYELFEWAMAVLLDPAGGDRFLGTQGDVWDAQSDMLFAGIGATFAIVFLQRLHDRAIEKMQRTLATCTTR